MFYTRLCFASHPAVYKSGVNMRPVVQRSLYFRQSHTWDTSRGLLFATKRNNCNTSRASLSHRANAMLSARAMKNRPVLYRQSQTTDMKTVMARWCLQIVAGRCFSFSQVATNKSPFCPTCPNERAPKRICQPQGGDVGRTFLTFKNSSALRCAQTKHTVFICLVNHPT